MGSSCESFCQDPYQEGVMNHSVETVNYGRVSGSAPSAAGLDLNFSRVKVDNAQFTVGPNSERVMQVLNFKPDPSLCSPGAKEDSSCYQLNNQPGLLYQGSWKDDKPHGVGRLLQKNKKQITNGVFQQGKLRHGLHVYESDGSYYLGEYQDFQFNGKGKFFDNTNKMSYEGQWNKFMPTSGKETYSSGSTYEGPFANGLKEGKGVFIWYKDGKPELVYRGQFVKGQMHGVGTLEEAGSPTGSKYEGNFVNNKKSGKGEMRTALGTYRGEFKDNLMDDPAGTFEWNDKRVYKGGFKAGKLDGKGVITFPNGQKAESEWKNGENIKILSASAIQAK